MKRTFTLLAPLLLAGSQLIGQITDPSPYCAADFSDDFMQVDKYFDKVELNGWSNAGVGQFAAPHYVYYNNLTPVDLDLNGTYDLKLDHDGGVSIHGIAAWIDFNKNNQFEDGEKVGEKLFPGTGTPGTETFSFTVPSDAAVGITRMRVRIYEDDDYTFSGNDLPVLPCYYDSSGIQIQYDWGETEDYDVNLVDPNAGGTTSISELNRNTIKVGPNPVENELYIHTQDADDVLQVAVFDIHGRKVKQVTQFRNTLDVSDLNNGIYFVQLTLNNATTTTVRVMKK